MIEFLSFFMVGAGATIATASVYGRISDGFGFLGSLMIALAFIGLFSQIVASDL
jgi:hypothetical protein